MIDEKRNRSRQFDDLMDYIHNHCENKKITDITRNGRTF